MWLRRLFAVLVAVGLVVGAVQIRARLFGDRGVASADGEVSVVCVRELARVCEAAADGTTAVIEDAATTVERFLQADPGVDVWVTVDPWPELAAGARDREGLAAIDSVSSDVLARSPVVLAARDDRLAALEPSCRGGELSWRCIGDRSGEPWDDLGGQSAWGEVDVGLHRPAATAEGLLTLAQATSSYFGEPTFTSQSLRAPDYFAWLSDLARAAGGTGGQSPLERMLLTGGADVEFTGVLEGTALPLLNAAPQRAERIQLRALDPVVTADVRVIGYGPTGQRAGPDVAERLLGPLADNGWRTADSPPPAALRDVVLPDDNGLPSAAALERLRQTWNEVAQ